MSKEQFKLSIDKFEELPGLLAAAQQDLEKEKLAKLALETERDVLLNEIDSLVCKKYIDSVKSLNT